MGKVLRPPAVANHGGTMATQLRCPFSTVPVPAPKRVRNGGGVILGRQVFETGLAAHAASVRHIMPRLSFNAYLPNNTSIAVLLGVTYHFAFPVNKHLLLLASAALLLAGCEQAQKTKEAYSNLSKISEAGEKMTAKLDQAKEQRAEREKRGDTLALPYKELEGYLPTAVSGYTAGELSGQSQKISGMSFSSAERDFTQGEDKLEVKLMDYNGAHDLYQGAAAMYSLGLESENDEQIVGPSSLKIDGVTGMETFYKKDGRAEMSLAVGSRFLLTISATKQKDMSLLQAVARDMDLEKLTKL